MNPAIRAMSEYLSIIAPFANKWTAEQFADPKVREDRLAPTATVFPILSRPLPGWFEQLLLGRKRSDALIDVLIWVNYFNWQNERIEKMVGDTKYANIVSLHVGILNELTNAFNVAKDSLR